MIRLCPICKNPSDSEKNSDFPFCSERCRLLDLGNWASGSYVISEPVIDEDTLDEQHLPPKPFTPKPNGSNN